ncbi:MAG: acyltransferase family protein [Pseudomonadota bacterium]
MQYRREVDGLRAVAVVPVILFHAGFDTFGGGFVGVDVFFVISGYLITTIILNELDAGRFSLLNFYERRARRILPALFFVMLVCLPFAWAWLMPGDMKDFAQSIVAVSTFSSNILFWQESGYFDTASELKPLLHTWSLAVEEQYYIIFPVFLMLIWQFGRRAVVIVLGLFFALSLGLAQWGAHNSPTAAFYLLPMRGWELLIGAFVAFWLQKGQRAQPGAVSQIASLLGLLLILYSIFAYDKSTPFPGFYALVPTLGVALILVFAVDGTCTNRLLGQPFLVGLGLVSYSAYLWHQPLFAFVRYRSLHEPSHVTMVILSLFTFALAYGSWRYVEKPFRNKARIARASIFKFAVTATVLFASLGIVGHTSFGFPDRVRNGHALGPLDEKNRPNFGLSPVCERQYTESPACVSGPRPTALLWGDSFAMHLAGALSNGPQPLAFRQHTLSSCLPLLDLSIVGNGKSRAWADGCIEQNNRVLQWVGNNRDVDLVILSSPFVFSNNDLLISGRVAPYDEKKVLARLEKTVQAIEAMGKRVVVVSPPPSNGNDLGRCVIKAIAFGSDRSLCNFDVSDYWSETQEAYALLRQAERFVSVLWLDRLICPNGTCATFAGNTNLYRDKGHFSVSGAMYLATEHALPKKIKTLAQRDQGAAKN